MVFDMANLGEEEERPFIGRTGRNRGEGNRTSEKIFT